MSAKGKPPWLRLLRWLREILLVTQPPLLLLRLRAAALALRGGDARRGMFVSSTRRFCLQRRFPMQSKATPCLILLFALVGSCAQRKDDGSFPSRNISIIVPFKPGGGFDLQARMLAPFLEKYLPNKIHVAIENVSSAGGKMAAVQLGRSRPNGYTIGLSGIDCLYACHGATGGRSPELELAGSIRLRAALGRCQYTVRTQITSRHEEQKFSIWCYERNAPLGCNPVQGDWRQIPARSFRWFRRGRAGSNSRRC